jgi:ABC-type sugar transport system ATPase subunit
MFIHRTASWRRVLVTVTLENLVKNFGTLRIINGLNLKVNDKEFLTLLGPSGCGKTTTLRCIAGLETVDGGKILMDDKVINDISPQQRDIAMVFQSYALYPFMSVKDNITFPLRLHKEPKDKIERRLKETSELLHISHLLERKPKQLSGGEQQRVAVGRALIRDPKLFLLDEPFSNLDAKLRGETRSEIKRLQKELGITTIFVTHDQAEAMALADRIAVMDKGDMQQLGAPNDVYGQPVNMMVAQFMGSPAMNILEAKLERPDSLVMRDGTETVKIRRPEVEAISAPVTGDTIMIGFRPEQAIFVESAGQGIPAEVYTEEATGTHMLLTLSVSGKLIRLVMPPDFNTEIGTKGSIEVKPGRLHIFDPKSGTRLH